MEKEKILKHLDHAIETQIPDVWDKIQNRIVQIDGQKIEEAAIIPSKRSKLSNRINLYKRLSLAAAVCLFTILTLSFTPALATIQEMYDKLFSSEHIDDTGLKAAIDIGHGQFINQTFYDQVHDITVNFQKVMTDEQETKLLLTFQSKKTNLENYYLDIFEGDSSIILVNETGEEKRLDNYGWGSRYYDSKENKVVEALSFESIKEFAGQDIHLKIENLTVYHEKGKGKTVETTWPLTFNLDASGVSERETIELNKEITFENETYLIKQVEFSEFETKVVVTGTDTGPYTDENGDQFDVMSKLEKQLLNSRKFKKGYGYFVDHNKSGVFLRSAGKKVEPIFSKNELPGPLGQYVMIFAKVQNPNDCVLEVGENIKIDLRK